MFLIQGKYGDAKCYATEIENSCIEQIKSMLDMPFAKDANTAIMPDAHAGKGCTIGTTMKIVDKIVPNLVGVDIGCGMLTANIGKAPINLPVFDAACHKIPSGFDVWQEKKEDFNLEELRCYRNLRDTKRILRSIGTLGGGNHFLEVDKTEDGTQYIVIHSGSRNLGKQVAEYYQNLAIELHSGLKEYYAQKDGIIKSYKEQGRRNEIQPVLEKLKKQYKAANSDIPKDLCWLSEQSMEDYLHDVKICQDFAYHNRERMLTEILKITGLEVISSFHTIHNYIDIDEMILRKGAISAKKGEIVLIPLNMRDGSIIARGKGNEEWNYSAPHGAGRIMSRSQAKKTIDFEKYKESMNGIYSTSICEETLDESPFAYKSIENIIEPIKEAVDIVDIIKPIFNFKAS